MRLNLILFIVLLLTGTFAQEKFEFVAEVGRVLDIIINSLYTQKQIFLRQLISNASDALDKIRFLAISDPNVLGSQTQLEIKVQYDEDKKILEIIDNGIGMTKNQLINNLGTVAKSGTASFLDAMKDGNLNLIGQFGVGFYSSFLTGSRVEVISKHNNDTQHKWSSSASNSFTIQEDNSVQLKRGTIVRLFLKEQATQFAKYEQLKQHIQRYSSFINYPIYLMKKVEVQDKMEKTQAQIEEEKQKIIEQRKTEGKEIDEEEIQNSINRTVVKKTWKTQFERLNENKPLWLRDKSQITDEQYKQFYKSVFQDSVPPLTWTHFKAEGGADFTGLIFVPQRAPYDQFQKFFQKKSEVKLYVRRVLINDEFENLLPKYLNFLKVIVDSDTLPLNVNRENIQQSKILDAIGSKLKKKAVDMLLSYNPRPEDKQQQQFEQQEQQNVKNEGYKSQYDKKVDIFNKFWKNYAKNIKYGIMEDRQNRQKLAQLGRWYTTNNISEVSSLQDYILRMQDGQKDIYYLGGQNKEIIAKSPFIQRLIKQGYEVLIGDDPMDQNVFHQLRSFKEKSIINVARNDFKQPYKTDELRKQVKYLSKTFKPFIDYVKNQLKNQIKDVKVSMRLVNTPVVIVADMLNDTPNLQRIKSASSMKTNIYATSAKNIFEFNPHDPMIQKLNQIIADEPDQNTAKLIKNLYYAGLIHSGFSINDPLFFSKTVFSMINTAFEVKEKQEFSEIVVTQEDIDAMQAQQEAQKASKEVKPQASAEAQIPKVEKVQQTLDLDETQDQQKKQEQEKSQQQNKQQQKQEQPSGDQEKVQSNPVDLDL